MKRKKNSGTRSVISDIGIGLITAIVISLVLGLLTAILVATARMEEDHIKFMVTGIQIIAPLSGAILAGIKAGQKYALICGGVSAAYCFMLLALTIIVFNCEFQSVGFGVGMCALGGVAACAICMVKKGRRTSRKKCVL